MRLHSINLCTTWRKGIVGIQLFLTENPDDATSVPIALDPLGKMDEGSCEMLDLSGGAGIKILKLGYDDNEIAIEFTVAPDMEKKEYGDLEGNWAYVSMRDVKPIVGLYGKTDDKGLTSLLGFLHLNTECQSELGKEEEIVLVEEEPTFEEKHKGFTISTPFILLIGIVVYFIVLLTAKRLSHRTQTKVKEGIEIAIVNRRDIGWRRAQSVASRHHSGHHSDATSIQVAPLGEDDETLENLNAENTLRVPDMLGRMKSEAPPATRTESMKLVDQLSELN